MCNVLNPFVGLFPPVRRVFVGFSHLQIAVQFSI